MSAVGTAPCHDAKANIPLDHVHGCSQNSIVTDWQRLIEDF